MTKDKIKELLKDIKEIQKNAYVPYSNFRVAVIVGLKNQKQILGVNVENASFPTSVCAERTALSQVITLGYKKNDIEFLFLITDSKDFAFPCGICRQFMIEIMPLDTKVYISNFLSKNEKEIKIISVKDLLPFAFMPNSLKGN